MKILRNMKNRLLRFCSLMLLCTLSGYASAEIVDDIILKKNTATDEIDAIIKFNIPIQYIRHFPQQKSSFLVISFNILDKASPDQWLGYETRKSPPSDFISGFTVTTRDVKTGPKVEIQFMRTAEYSVTAGRDNRSLLVHIKPIASAVATIAKPMSQRIEKDDLPPFPEIAQPAPEVSVVKVTLA
jgi:hypothetical protein